VVSQLGKNVIFSRLIEGEYEEHQSTISIYRDSFQIHVDSKVIQLMLLIYQELLNVFILILLGTVRPFFMFMIARVN